MHDEEIKITSHDYWFKVVDFLQQNWALIVPYWFNSPQLCCGNKKKKIFRFDSSRLCREKISIDEDESGAAIVYFFGDTSGVFDQMSFTSKTEAETALRRNGFTLYDEDVKAQEFIAKPNPPFHSANHPNGLIYSSGKFWR